jgi:hypothetical protein
MKIEVDVKKTEKTTVDVDFPLCYRYEGSFDTGGWYETYHRVEESGREDEIHINDRGEWEYRKAKANLPNLLGYILVEKRWQYEIISASVFYEKLAEMRAALDAIPAGKQ